MTFLRSPVVLAVVVLGFSFFAWHNVENGMNAPLKAELAAVKKENKSLQEENALLKEQVKGNSSTVSSDDSDE